MEKIKSLPACALPFTFVLLASHQVQAGEIFSGSVSVNSLISDNTTKVALDPVEERQDTYEAGLAADYSNWLIEANADYHFYAKKFADKSQADDEYIDGSSTLTFGKEQDPFGLELSHSRRMLLQSPDAVDLIENMDEREIISAAPIIRARILSADMLFLQGQVSQVNFLDDDERDSLRNSVSLGWAHPISVTDILQFSAQQSKIEFDQQPDADYKLSNAMLSYAVELRKLNYRVELGYNEVSPAVGTDEGAPAYKAEVGYESGYNTFSAAFSQQITDSSFGDGNTNDPAQIPSGDGLTLDLERLDRKKVNVNWGTSVICGRCSFSIGASLEDDEYLESGDTSRNTYLRSEFGYSFSTAARLSFSFNRSKYKFEGSDILNDYRIDYVAVKYNYTFLNGIDVQLFARKEDRDSDIITNSYEENMYGAGLGYFF